MKDIVWIGINILCVIYTISFALYEIKGKRFLSGVFSIVLSVSAIVLSVVRIFLV